MLMGANDSQVLSSIIEISPRIGLEEEWGMLKEGNID